MTCPATLSPRRVLTLRQCLSSPQESSHQWPQTPCCIHWLCDTFVHISRDIWSYWEQTTLSTLPTVMAYVNGQVGCALRLHCLARRNSADGFSPPLVPLNEGSQMPSPSLQTTSSLLEPVLNLYRMQSWSWCLTRQLFYPSDFGCTKLIRLAQKVDIYIWESN